MKREMFQEEPQIDDRAARPQCSTSSPNLFVVLTSGMLIAIGLLGPGRNALAGEGSPSQRYSEARFEFDAKQLALYQDGAYTRAEYPGAIFDLVPEHRGRPRLPMSGQWFILPDETKISSVTATVQWDTIPGEHVPIPLGADDPENAAEEDGGVYGGETPYPEQPYFVARDAYLRGYHLAQVGIALVKWDPRQDRLLFAREVEVSISLRPMSPEESAQVVRVHRPEAIDTPSGALRRMVLSRVCNPQEFDVLYGRARADSARHRNLSQSIERTPFGGTHTRWPSPEGIPVRLIIITDNQNLSGEPIGNVLDAAEEYARFRSDYGTETKVVAVSEILSEGQHPAYLGKDVAERLRAYIRDAVQQWGTMFVILGGDVDVVPTRRLGSPTDGGPTDIGGIGGRSDPPSDLYYAIMGDEWNPNQDAWEWGLDDNITPGNFGSVYVGRLPFRDAAEAEIMFRKLIEYRFPTYFGKYSPIYQGYYMSCLAATGLVNSADPTTTSNGHFGSEQVLAGLADWYECAECAGHIEVDRL